MIYICKIDIKKVFLDILKSELYIYIFFKVKTNMVQRVLALVFFFYYYY